MSAIHKPRGARAAGTIVAGLVLALAAAMGLAAPAHAEPVVNIALQAMNDGTPAWDDAPGPARDTGPDNGQVRSYDTVEYAWTVNVNSSDASTETFDRLVLEQTLPAGLSWRESDVPLYCQGAGWGISGQTLTCVYEPVGGTGTTGSTLHFSLKALAGAVPDGTVIPAPQATVTVSSGATTSAPATATAEPVTIRSSAFIDMFKRSPVGRTAPGGYYIDYTVGIEIPAGRRNTFGRRGFLMPQAPVTFTDDLSGVSPNAEFVSCSGALTCTPGPGQTVDISIDTLPADPPAGNSAIASGTLRLFVPQADVDADDDGTLQTVNVIEGLVADAPAAGGGTVPSEGENPANNTASYNLVTVGGIGNLTATKRFLSATGQVLPTQLSSGDGNGQVRDGQILTGNLVMTNSSQVATVPTPAVCDVWDNARIHLSTAGPGPTANAGRPVWLVTSSGFGGSLVEGDDYVIEYGTQATATGDDTARWNELRARSSCTDGSDTWTTTPPSDLSTVTKVRIRLLRDLPAGGSAMWRVNFEIDHDVEGDLVANFLGRAAGTTWVASAYGPLQHTNVNSGDRVRVNGVTVGIRKRSIDPAVAFGSPATILSGTGIRFELVPEVTALDIGTGPAVAHDVVIRDRLALGLTYDAGRPVTPAGLEPTITSDAEGRQILTWTIPSMTAGSEPTITYWVKAADTAINERINEVIIDSEEDIGGLTAFPASTPPSGEQHYSRQTVILQSAGGVRVSKAALQTVVEPIDEIGFRIEYANLTPSGVSDIDIIEVLPFAGDGNAAGNVPGRSPATDARGTLPLKSVTVTAGETVRYTDADPAAVYATTDPQATDDAAFGTLPAGRQWCLESELGQPGCPDGLEDVTAIRVTRASLGSGQVDAFTVRLAPTGDASGDVVSNTAALRYGAGNLGALSNVAATRVIANRIGDVVWHDRNRNGIQDDDEPKIPNVRVTLTGTDKHGRTISVETRTDGDGGYWFTGATQASQDAGIVDLVSGDYEVTFHLDGLPAGTRFTTRNAPGSTAADGSDADPDTGKAAVTLPDPTPAGVDGVNPDIDAGIILPAPGGPGNPGGPGTPGGSGGTPPSGGAHDGPPLRSGDDPGTSSGGASQTGSPRLTVEKTARERQVRAGQPITYTIAVANRGDAPARRTVVCDRPGAGLAIGRVPAGARLRNGRICWRLGTLQPGERRTVRVTMTTDRTLRRGRVVNRVTVNAQRVRRTGAATPVRVRPDRSAVSGVRGQTGVTG
jgi:uncharacterized repeat protein (TIGR01451 family)